MYNIYINTSVENKKRKRKDNNMYGDFNWIRLVFDIKKSFWPEDFHKNVLLLTYNNLSALYCTIIEAGEEMRWFF